VLRAIITATATTTSFLTASVAAGNFDNKSFTKKFLAVKVIDDVFSISVVSEFNESKSILQVDLTDVAVSSKKLFDIAISAITG